MHRGFFRPHVMRRMDRCCRMHQDKSSSQPCMGFRLSNPRTVGQSPTMEEHECGLTQDLKPRPKDSHHHSTAMCRVGRYCCNSQSLILPVRGSPGRYMCFQPSTHSSCADFSTSL